MLKYYNYQVTFSEVPDEISLCINITNCPNNCEGCHSPYLREDIGETLTTDILYDLVVKNKGITCICFLGGDSNPEWINFYAKWIKDNTDLLVAWYSGNTKISDEIELKNFNYIKIGPYIKILGPLTEVTTNQVFYKVVPLREYDTRGNQLYGLEDITSKFYK